MAAVKIAATAAAPCGSAKLETTTSLASADDDAEQHQAGDGAEPDGHDHPAPAPCQEDGAEHEQDRQDDAADGDDIEGLDDALCLLEPGGLEERDGREVLGQGDAEGPLQERPAGGAEGEPGHIGQLGIGGDDADLLELPQDRVDERIDVEVDDAVARLEDGRVATQEGHDLLVQRAIGVDPDGLELRRDEDVADDLLERLLDLVGDGRGDDRRGAGQHLLQATLDVDGGDDAGRDPGADEIDDGRVARDRRDHGRVAVAVQQDLVRPDGHAGDGHGDRAEEEQEARPGASGREADGGRSGRSRGSWQRAWPAGGLAGSAPGSAASGPESSTPRAPVLRCGWSAWAASAGSSGSVIGGLSTTAAGAASS